MGALPTLGGIGSAINDFTTANAEGQAQSQAAFEHQQDRDFQGQERQRTLEGQALRLQQMRQQLESNLSPEAKDAQVRAKKGQLHNLVNGSTLDENQKKMFNFMVDFAEDPSQIGDAIIKAILIPPVQKDKDPKYYGTGPGETMFSVEDGKRVVVPGGPNPPKVLTPEEEEDKAMHRALMRAMIDDKNAKRDEAAKKVSPQAAKIAADMYDMKIYSYALDLAEKANTKYAKVIGPARGRVASLPLVGGYLKTPEQEVVTSIFANQIPSLVAMAGAKSRGYMKAQMKFFTDNMAAGIEKRPELNQKDINTARSSLRAKEAELRREARVNNVDTSSEAFRELSEPLRLQDVMDPKLYTDLYGGGPGSESAQSTPKAPAVAMP
jgi:hypothetical protein